MRAAAKGAPDLMGACDELRDTALVELGVRVEDRVDGARWTLDEPAVLRAEQQATLPTLTLTLTLTLAQGSSIPHA